MWESIKSWYTTSWVKKVVDWITFWLKKPDERVNVQ